MANRALAKRPGADLGTEAQNCTHLNMAKVLS